MAVIEHLTMYALTGHLMKLATPNNALLLQIVKKVNKNTTTKIMKSNVSVNYMMYVLLLVHSYATSVPAIRAPTGHPATR